MSQPEIRTESRLTFFEATSIIIGHGIGAGVLTVPFFASLTHWWDILWLAAVVYAINLVMHYMVAELSYNNGGLQFIKCLERELFVGKLKNIISYTCFALLTLSVIMNVAGYISGAAAVFNSWFGLDLLWGKLLFYVLAAAVVYGGMKIVGFCQKIAVSAMIAVVIILLLATMFSTWYPLAKNLAELRYLLALYSLVAFSLSAVMSAPQVVKGLQGDVKGIRGAIALGTALNLVVILAITFLTLIGAKEVTKNGALVDLSNSLGGWVAIVGYLFSLLALSTSFWANTLNLRDVIQEQLKIGLKWAWLAASLPCLLVAIIGQESFVGFVQLAAAIQIVTGVGIIIAYNRSRRKNPSIICGVFGSLPWQIIVVLSSILATVGSFIR